MNKQLIAVLIPTYNRMKYLRVLLYQLIEQKIPVNTELKIIVINDGSDDGTPEMLARDFPNVYCVIGNGNWWFTKCINAGYEFISEKEPSYLLILNDDCEIENNYLQNLLSSTHEVPHGSIIGSLVITKKKPHRILASGVIRQTKILNRYITYHKFLHPIDTIDLVGYYPTIILPGKGMLIPTSTFEKLNGFDEFFRQYHSDGDFCLSARKQGINVYISYQAFIYTHHNKTSESSSFIRSSLFDLLKSYFVPTSRNYIPSKIRFLWKHSTRILLPLNLFFFVLITMRNHWRIHKANV